MRQGIGSIALYNIIIVFIVITFGFLIATLSYVKAFKVNGRIASIIEKYEGFNDLSAAEISRDLETIGYRMGDIDCPSEKTRIFFEDEGTLLDNPAKHHMYCVYEYPDDDEDNKKDGYITYGVETYIYVDIPLISGTFKLPVYTETEPIFNFSA